MKHYVKYFSYCILFLCLIVFTFLPAQNTKFDSIEKALATATDTAKVKLLISYCIEQSETAPESAAIRGEQALSLAKELKFVSGQTNAMQAIAYSYMFANQNKKAMALFKDALALSQKNSLKNNCYEIYISLGEMYLSSGIYDTAFENYNNALQIAQTLGKKIDEIIPLNSIAAMYYFQSKYDKALEYYLNALKIAEALNQKDAQAQSLLNIGSVYFSQNEYDKALHFYEDALSINEQLKDKGEIARCMNNIGTVCEKKKEYDKALDFYLKALKLKEELGNKKDIENTLSNIGNLYSLKSDYDKGIEYYSKALKLSEENNNKSGLAQGNINLGTLYSKKKEYDKALEYLNTGLPLAKEVQRKDFIQTCYEELAEVYSKKGDYKAAFENHKLFSSVKDSILNDQSNKNIADMQTKYETDKKEKEIEIQKTQLSRQAVVRNSFIVGFILILLIAFLTYNRYRIKKKGNELLTAINKELDMLSLVASETHNGVIICEGDGTLLYVNRGMYRLLGYTFEDILSQFGKKLQDFSHNPEIDNLIGEALNKKKPVYYESLNTTKSGQKLWIATTLTPILDESGNISKIVVIDVDIHDNKLKSLQIEDQSREIQESISYARRIQNALLPDLENITHDLPKSFVLYKPKAVVSGDFYWYHNWFDSFVIAAIDCTGHGVPGAFMSVMAHNILHQISTTSVIARPGYVLENLHETIRISLKQNKANSESRDGMDVAMCRISNDKKSLEFAGAMRSLYHIRNGILTEIKGDKHAIGGYQSEERRKFTTHTIQLEEADCIYISSDGFADQFGGPERKKFMTKHMKDLLVSISIKPMDEQYKILNKAFEDWRGDNEQIDDVLVIGVKI